MYLLNPSILYNCYLFFLIHNRLKNLEIGFTFPRAWSKVINAKKIRIYANGFNLITWDKMRFDDWDPEVLKNTTYPVLKVINIGANITF